MKGSTDFAMFQKSFVQNLHQIRNLKGHFYTFSNSNSRHRRNTKDTRKVNTICLLSRRHCIIKCIPFVFKRHKEKFYEQQTFSAHLLYKLLTNQRPPSWHVTRDSGSRPGASCQSSVASWTCKRWQLWRKYIVKVNVVCVPKNQLAVKY